MSQPSKKQGWFDSLLVSLAPAWAAKRAESRVRLEYLDGVRAYAGAEVGRLMGSWLGQLGTSADTELLESGDQATMRNRSRELNQNDPHAAAATSTTLSYTVGDQIRMQAKCKPDSNMIPPHLIGAARITEQAALAANEHIEAAFSEIENSIDGNRMSFTEYIELMMRQELECGEGLSQIIASDRSGSRLKTAVRPIEPDRLATPNDKRSVSDIRHGIEFDDDVPVAYWIAKRHPGDAVLIKSDDFVRVPAGDIIHSYTVKRPGQSRGVPWFAPALKYFRHKSQSTEAELIAQRVAACISAFVTTETPRVTAQALSTSSRTSDGARQQKLEPGKIMYLRPGEKVDFGDPTRPGTNWVPSHHEILRAIGTSLNIPYVVLAKDFENVNYSSMRAAIVDMQRYVATYRARLRTRVIRPIWERVYEEAVMAGMVRAPGYAARKTAYREFSVQWSGSQWVDPWKEVQADVLAVESGLLPHAFVLAKYGLDADVFHQIAGEKATKDKLGIGMQPEDTKPGSQKPDSPGRGFFGRMNGNGNGQKTQNQAYSQG